MDEDTIRSLPHWARQEARFWAAEAARAESAVLKTQAARAFERVLARAKAAARRPYSTRYACDWGKTQGWRLLERERWNADLKRHFDLFAGGDALFLTDDGLVMVQAAPPGERAEHRRRFEERGGPEICRKAKIRFVYAEFKRGKKSPVALEEWA